MTSDMTAITFEIPNGTELTSNRMGGSRYATDAAKRKLKACIVSQINQPEPVFEPVHALWVIEWPKGATPMADADNWQPTGKIAIDALVKAGMFTDDRAEFIHATTYRRGRDLPTKGHHWITLHLMACPWDSHLACLESALAGLSVPI